MPTIDDSRDAFGQALLDHHDGRPGAQLMLEGDDGWSRPAMQPAAFFAAYEAWPYLEQQAMPLVVGSVLDVGAGAGRHALYLQDHGHEVTAVDWSPGAVEVCRSRGISDVRLADVTSLEIDRRWDTVLLMCGNLGLAGDWSSTRRLLTRLANATAPGGLLIGDSVDPASDDPDDMAYAERNRLAGFHPGRIRLRLRYRELVSPWWEQLNLPADDIVALVDGTGWRAEHQLEDGADHLAVLRR